MLGDTLDYLLLRSLAHTRNRATEEELDRRSGQAAGDAENAAAKLDKLVGRFDGHFPLDPSKRYLDMGCGPGDLTLALARRGIRRIDGVDFLPRYIQQAQALAARSQPAAEVRFLCRDLRTWMPEEKYDVLLSFDALEHIGDPRAFLGKMADFAAPGGRAVLAFGPLFHSPFGDHMWDFFKLQVPWRGVLFSENAILRVRRECFRPTDPASAYRDIAGGLNLMRYSDFLAYVRGAGWEFDYLAVNTFLRRMPPLRLACDALMRVPGLRDYFVHNVYTVLRRRSVAPR
ncbi:MAG TPA: class I SAM-dependent methyltransferase [Burkholderiales bacterium]|nr:class I SAM-dependent methyltransferase [Burkholderiales bacterium]